MIRLTSPSRRAARPAGRSVAGRPATDHGPRTTDKRTRGQEKGFTLVELLIVIVVLVVLLGLLLPAINGAMRTARNAAASAEINQLAQALANFKSKYGDYPPSRFLCVESGNYQGLLGSGNTALNNSGSVPYDPTSPGAGDIQSLVLVQRSIATLRRFWPRISTSVLPTGAWYDFNGNGVLDTTPYVLHGHECLVFFLGGVPLLDSSTGTYGLTGFGKDPTNPFTNMVNNGNNMYNPNRQEPFYQFNAGRLFLDPNSNSGIPGYFDTLNNGPPGSGSLNFFAYFSAYGNNNYDPNDVNFLQEQDAMGNAPIQLEFLVTFPTFYNKSWTNGAISPAPNPYTTTTTQPSSNTVNYQSPQTFQIISAGADGQYGVGGQYIPSSQTGATQALPFDATNTYYGSSYANETDGSIRQRERDNLTNFKQGRLD